MRVKEWCDACIPTSKHVQIATPIDLHCLSLIQSHCIVADAVRANSTGISSAQKHVLANGMRTLKVCPMEGGVANPQARA